MATSGKVSATNCAIRVVFAVIAKLIVLFVETRVPLPSTHFEKTYPYSGFAVKPIWASSAYWVPDRFPVIAPDEAGLTLVVKVYMATLGSLVTFSK
ncbi:hypothetical protein D3C85_1375530 [compost metagenome]